MVTIGVVRYTSAHEVSSHQAIPPVTSQWMAAVGVPVMKKVVQGGQQEQRDAGDQ